MNKLSKKILITIITITLSILFIKSDDTKKVIAEGDFNNSIPKSYINMGNPRGLMVNEDGSIWFVDDQDYRIVKLSNSGETLRTIGRHGSEEGEFNDLITDITKDNNGNIYVSGANRIYKFDFNGGFLATWGSEGCDPSSGDVGRVNGITYDKFTNTLLITNECNQVIRLSKNGEYIKKFGESGSGNGQFQGPVGITTDINGQIYVVDSGNHRLQIFDSNGNHLYNIGHEGSGPGELTWPKDVAVFDDGFFAVSSQNSNQIQIFDASRQYSNSFYSSGPVYLDTDGSNTIYFSDWVEKTIESYTKYGLHNYTIGNGVKVNGKFLNISDFDYDSLGNLYVVDDGGQYARLQKLTNSGTYISTIVSPGTMNESAYHIAIDANDRIFFSDNEKITVFDTSGNVLFEFGSPGIGPGEFRQTRDMDFDENGNVYVADMYNHRIQKFDSMGNYITEWGGKGNMQGKFIHPTYVVIHQGFVYVGENKNDYDSTYQNTTRIQKFTLDGTYVETILTFDEFDVDGKVFQIGGMEFDNANNFYVSDNYYSKIQIFDSNLNFVSKIQNFGSGYDEYVKPGALKNNPITGIMTIADSGNHRLQSINNGVRIYNLISSLDVNRSYDKLSLVNNHINPIDPGSDQIDSELFFGPYIVSDFDIDLTNDRNWQSVNAVSLPTESKALLINMNPVNAPGVEEYHTIYLVKHLGQTSVHVCPEAYYISDIALDCEGGYTLLQGDPNLFEVNIDGVDYWKVSNLSGTGIMSESTIDLSITLNKYTATIGEPISITVTALNGIGKPDTRYLGTIQFTSSSSTTSLPSNFTFTAINEGVGMFVNLLTFTESGTYTVTVTDTTKGYLSAVSSDITILGPTATPTPIPTNTATPIPTAVPSNTPTPIPTNTLVPSPTITTLNTPTTAPTNTTAPTIPGSTNTPIPISTISPSNTIIPTNLVTSIPDTVIPTDTVTPIVPTATLEPILIQTCEENPIQAKCLIDVEIQNISQQKIGESNMQICWDTNIGTKGNIIYGFWNDGLLNQSTPVEAIYIENNHCFTLSNLTTNTRYIYRITATSVAGKSTDYDGSFLIGIETLPETGEEETPVSQCITIDINSYSFDALKQARIEYTTSTNRQCYIRYGMDNNRVQFESAKTSGITHLNLLSLNNLDGISDLYYQIECQPIEGNSATDVCSYNGIIPANRYKQYINPVLAEKIESQGIIEYIFSSPENLSVSLTSTAITATAATATMATLAYPQWLSYGLLWITRRKKNNPWGIIFDGTTNNPVSFAVIRVQAIDDDKIKQTITDTKGRFSMILDPGDYYLEINHPEYEKVEKGLTVKASNEENFDIALIPNGQKNTLNNIQSSIRRSIRTISLFLSGIGFAFTLFSVLLNANTFNLIVLFIYLIQFTALILTSPVNGWGYVFDKTTEQRIKGAFVRLFDIEEQRQVDVQLVDEQGRFGFIAENKEYLLKVDANGYKFIPDDNSSNVEKINGEYFFKVSGNKTNNLNIALVPVV